MEPTKGKLLEEPIQIRRKKPDPEDYDIGHELALSEQAYSLTPNFLFSLLPQPDRNVAIQSSANGGFIRVYIHI